MVTEQYTACIDCLMIIANDDASGMDDATEQACRAGIYAIGAARGYHLSAGYGESSGFSRRPCSICGGLAGDRYPVTAIRPVRPRVRIYDNGGKTADRYTVYFLAAQWSPHSGRFYGYYCCSDNPFHPQGVGMYGETDRLPPVHCPEIGKRVSFNQVPAGIQRLIERGL